MTCLGGPHARKFHMAVNHREPGNNFHFRAGEEYHHYLTSLLATGPFNNLTEQNGPIEFESYKNLKPLLPMPAN